MESSPFPLHLKKKKKSGLILWPEMITYMRYQSKIFIKNKKSDGDLNK